MPDTFGLSNEPLAPQRWSMSQKDMSADFAQQVGTQKARAAGANFQDAILEGIKARESSTDPFFELKKLEFESRIADHAALALDRMRTLTAKKHELKAEQQDKNDLLNLSLKTQGDPQAALAAISSFTPRSNLGRTTANDQRLAIVSLMDHDQNAKNIASLSYEDRRKYRLALNENGGVPNSETDAILDAGLAHQATPTSITLGNGRVVNGWMSKGKFTADPKEMLDARDASVLSHIDARGQVASDLVDKRFENQQSLQTQKFQSQKDLANQKQLWSTLGTEEKTILGRIGKDYESATREIENLQKAGVTEEDDRMVQANIRRSLIAQRQSKFLEAVRPTPATIETPSGEDPGVPAAASPAPIPMPHADYLRAHPETANDFDAKYGLGSAAKILNTK